MARFIQLALAAVGFCGAAWPGLKITPEIADATGVYIGSGIGGFDVIEREHSKYLNGGPGKISPFFIPAAIVNLASGHVSIRYGAKGPEFRHGHRLLRFGARHRRRLQNHPALRRGSDDRGRLGSGHDADGHRRIRAPCARFPRATMNPSAPAALSTRERDGFVVGEGSGMLILESLEFAQRRGANILAEIVGYGMSGDAYHITQPAEGGDGGYRVSLAAIKDAKITPDDVSYVNAHGTSTPIGDAHRNRRAQARLRRTREESADQLDQVDDRASARRRGRTRSGHQRARAARPDSSADDQLGKSRSRRAISITSRTTRARRKSTTRFRILSVSAAPTRR